MPNSNEKDQSYRKSTGFQTRFLLVLAAILIIFSGVTTFIIYHHEMRNLEENAYDKTDLIMKTIEANSDYVQDVLRPTMYKRIGEDRFVLEAMSSSYISRMIMERFDKKARGFIYRRVAIDAKNPDYEANPLEIEMIQRFRLDPLLKEWKGIIELESKQYFMRFQPVVFSGACLNCHGNPDDAPKEVISIYGKTRGFLHKPEEISGVVGVGMPIDFNIDKIRKFAIALFAGVLPSILIVYVVISTFFNQYIAGNLRNILSFFRTNIKDEEGRSIFENSRSMDEIDELTSTARAIAEHLHNNQIVLENYADKILKSKDLLQSVFDGITDPVVLIDIEGKIKVVNAAFLKRYNLSLEQVLYQKPAEFLKNKGCPLTVCIDVFNPMPDHPINREVLMDTGEIFLIYFYPIQEQTKGAESMVCYIKDITEQKKMETRIQNTEKIASIGQLAAGIAHEINNPLGVILCHIDLIKDNANLSPEVRSDLEIIEKHAGNCRAIIADLLKFAHQDVSVKEPVIINNVIEDVVFMVQSQFRKQQIDIEMHLGKNIPIVTIDADKIKQVILNMLINSAQAIVEDGTITLHSQYEENSHIVGIIVEDNGPGIPSDVIDKIFDPFFTTKPPGKGTGLGLSVSYGIIRDHNGDITVESLPEKPTRFVISLPVQGEEQ